MTAKSSIKRNETHIPQLRHHKSSGQAYAIIDKKTVYFGRFDDPQSSQKYHQYIAEWLAAGKHAPIASKDITVSEIIARFWTYAQGYYVRPDGTPASEIHNFKLALRPLQELYGLSLAQDFGPRALCAVRNHLIQHGLCRNFINKQINRIRLMFKWAVSQEFVHASIYQALATVPGLRKGKSEAIETEPVKPVPQEHIDMIKPYVSKQVWTLIQLQLLTAARSGELVIMRPCNIDKSGRIWIYRPAQHKTAHHGHSRTIFIGPRAQFILRPYLLRPNEAYCFSPAEAEAERRAQKSKLRKTPLSCGNLPGTNVKDEPIKQPRNRYDVNAYARAIAKAIKNAYRPEGMSSDEFKKWKPEQHWHPHQLRHNAATYLRKEFGLETARIILGHRSTAITEVYAEMDQQKALEAMIKVG